VAERRREKSHLEISILGQKEMLRALSEERWKVKIMVPTGSVLINSVLRTLIAQNLLSSLIYLPRLMKGIFNQKQSKRAIIPHTDSRL
jgi:hypothetical protein